MNPSCLLTTIKQKKTTKCDKTHNVRALHNFHNVSGGNGVLKREARKSFRFTVFLMKKHSANFEKVKGFNKDEPWKSVYVTVIILA